MLSILLVVIPNLLFSDVLESIKINVIFQYKNILVKENISLPDDRKSVKLEVVLSILT